MTKEEYGKCVRLIKLLFQVLAGNAEVPAGKTLEECSAMYDRCRNAANEYERLHSRVDTMSRQAELLGTMWPQEELCSHIG